MFKELNEKDFNNLDNQAKKDYLKKYLINKVEIFIAGVSAYSPDNAKLKAKAVSELLFIKLFQISIEKKINFRAIVDIMVLNAYDNYSQTSKIMDYSGFLLKALDYQSENDKKLIQANNAFRRLLKRGQLFYIKKSTNYFSEDKYLLASLEKIGIEYIISKVKCEGYVNVINDFALKSIKEDFIKYYLDFMNKGTNIEKIEGTGCLACSIKPDYPIVKFKQLEAPKSSDFMLNVGNVGVNIVNMILGN